jgi:hypothetical protein
MSLWPFVTLSRHFRRRRVLSFGDLFRAWVYLCEDSEDGSSLCIKEGVYEVELAANVILRGIPGVLPIRFAGHSDRGSFVLGMPVMETVRDCCLRCVPSKEERIRWAVRLCETLRLVHHKGLVHRDIKPSNLFLDELGSVFIGDWGSAVVWKRRQALTRDGMTPEFMAENARRGGKPCAADDFESLCYTLYWCNGSGPFWEDNYHARIPLAMMAKVDAAVAIAYTMFLKAGVAGRVERDKENKCANTEEQHQAQQ